MANDGIAIGLQKDLFKIDWNLFREDLDKVLLQMRDKRVVQGFVKRAILCGDMPVQFGAHARYSGISSVASEIEQDTVVAEIFGFRPVEILDGRAFSASKQA